MKSALIQLAIMIAVFYVFGTIAGWTLIIGSILLHHTKRGKQLSLKIKHRVLVWQYEKLQPWFKRHKNSWFFKSLENASWFNWYGKHVVYVKAKDPSKLSATQKDVKEAIRAKDYAKALEIVKGLPESPQTIALKQIIEAKLT